MNEQKYCTTSNMLALKFLSVLMGLGSVVFFVGAGIAAGDAAGRIAAFLFGMFVAGAISIAAWRDDAHLWVIVQSKETDVQVKPGLCRRQWIVNEICKRDGCDAKRTRQTGDYPLGSLEYRACSH